MAHKPVALKSDSDGDFLEQKPVDSRTVRRLWSAGLLDNDGRLAALRIVNGPTVWWPWIEKALLFLGMSLILAGVVCFFAWNWADLPGLAKLGVVQVAIVACCGIGLWKGLDTLAGKAAQTSAAVLVGVFLAVFGQVYQTGADAWQLFAGWAGLILPWVLLCRLSGLWLLWIVLVNLAIGLYWGQVLWPRGFPEEWMPVALGVLNGGAAALRETLARFGWSWLTIWLRQVLIPASLIFLSIPVLTLIIEGDVTTAGWASLLLLAIEVVVLNLQFRRRTPDLFVLTCGAATVTVLACVTIVRALTETGEEVIAFFLSGLAIVGLVALMARWLMHEARRIRAARASAAPTEIETHSAATSATEEAGERELQVSSRQLLGQLVEAGHLTEVSAATASETLVADAASEPAPWFIQCLIGFGAWIACLLFMGCFGLAGLFDGEVALLIEGTVLLAGGAVIDRKSNGVFFRQFGLAIGLTGGSLVCVGAFDIVPHTDFGGAALGASVATIAFYRAYRSSSFRFLSCLVSLLLATGWVLEDSRIFFGGDKDGLMLSMHVLVLLETLGVGLVFWRYGRGWLEPAGYAMAIGLLATLLLTLLPDGPSAWPSAVIQAIAQVWFLYHAATAGTQQRGELFGVPAAGVALLEALSAPGLLASIGMTVLGHLERNVVLKGLGLLFLPIYLAAYYYNMETTLLTKSLVLVGTGAVLWGARAWLQHRIAIWRIETEEF